MMDIPIYLYLLYGEYFYFSSMTLGFLNASAVPHSFYSCVVF